MKNLVLFSLTILITASSCRQMGGHRVRGNGNITTQTRSVSNFDGIYVGGAIDVYVKQDSVASVKVVADENLHEYLEIHTEGSTLEIHTQNRINLRSSQKIKVYVSGPTFRSFEVSGASNIYSENEINTPEVLSISMSGASEGRIELNAPKVDADISGASHLDLRGKTKDFTAGASGASEIKAYDLLTENTDVDFSGASSGEVFASVKVSGHVSGASHVNYKGNATSNISSSGASGVSKVQ